MRDDGWNGPVAIDANALDRTGRGRAALVDAFLASAQAGHFTLVVTGSVREELLRPETPREIRDAVLRTPSQPPRTATHEQKLDRIRARAILRGEGPTGKHEADAQHLSEAAEAGCATFITHDRRILRRRGDLRRILPTLRITTLEAFMAGESTDADEEGLEQFGVTTRQTGSTD